MKLKIISTVDGEPITLFITVDKDEAQKFAEIKAEEPELSDFDVLKKAKQIIEENRPLTKEEAKARFLQLLEQKELETGKCQMELLREMEYRLSQKEKNDDLTNFERGMLRTLRRIEEKCYNPEKLARDFKRRQQLYRIELLTNFMIEFCKSWNNLDISYIEPYLHEDVEYRSKWVDGVLKGKSEYLDYLKSKYQSLHRTMNLDLKADAGYLRGDGKYEIGRPCVIVSQKLNDRINSVVILFNGTKTMITQIEMKEVPKGRLVDFGIYYR